MLGNEKPAKLQRRREPTATKPLPPIRHDDELMTADMSTISSIRADIEPQQLPQPQPQSNQRWKLKSHRISHSTSDAQAFMMNPIQEEKNISDGNLEKNSFLKRQKSLGNFPAHLREVPSMKTRVENPVGDPRPYSQELLEKQGMTRGRTSDVSFLDARTRESMILAHQSMHNYLDQLVPNGADSLPDCDASTILGDDVLSLLNQRNSLDSISVFGDTQRRLTIEQQLPCLLNGVSHQDFLLQDEQKLGDHAVNTDFLLVLDRWLRDIDNASGLRAVVGGSNASAEKAPIMSEIPRMNPAKFLERRRKYLLEQRRIQSEIQKEKRFHQATWQLLQLYTGGNDQDPNSNKYTVSLNGSGSNTPKKESAAKQQQQTTEDKLRQALQGQRWSLPTTPEMRAAHDAALQAYWQSTQQLLSLEHQLMHVMRKLELLDRRWMSWSTRQLVQWVCHWKRDQVAIQLEKARNSDREMDPGHHVRNQSGNQSGSYEIEEMQREMMNLCREWVRQGDLRQVSRQLSSDDLEVDGGSAIL